MRTVLRGIGRQIAIDVGELLRKVRFRRRIDPHLQGAGRERKAARCLADAEIDPARRQRRQKIEIFRNLVGAVMLQHDAARTDPYPRSPGQKIGNQRFRS